MAIKIEEGKYYKTLDGDFVGPAIFDPNPECRWCWNIPLDGGEYWFDENGVSCLLSKWSISHEVEGYD